MPDHGSAAAWGTNQRVSEVFLEPAHQRVHRVEALVAISETVRRHGDVFRTRFVSWHVREAELTRVVLGDA